MSWTAEEAIKGNENDERASSGREWEKKNRPHHIYVNMEFVCETEYLENTFTSVFFIVVAIIVCCICVVY